MRRLVSFVIMGILLGTGSEHLRAQTWEDYDYENLSFRGIGLEMGWIVPPRVDHTLSLGLRVDLGQLGPHVRVRPGIAYWSSQLRQTEVDRLAGQIQSVCRRQYPSPDQCPPLDLGRIRMSDLLVNLDGQYEWTATQLLFVPYLGIGGGIHLLNGRGDVIDDTFVDDFLDSISPSLNLFGGVRVPLGEAFDVTGEARYVLSADIRHSAFTIGAVWIFPTQSVTAAKITLR